MRLLLAVDSVTTLEILLSEITARTWPNGTKARVLSIVEDGEVPLETWREHGYGIAAVRHEMRRRGEEINALALNRLRAVGIQAEVTVMRGNPDFLIWFTAEKWSADLIFIRAHNRTDFRNWMLGSVAKRVVDNAPCSVEIVRSTGDTNPFAINRPMRILLATDGSDVSLVASEAVAETIWPADTELKVVSVINPMIYSFEEIGFFRGKRTDWAHRAIGDSVNVLKGTPLKISGEVIAGRTARRIIDRAKNWHADLIVVGRHQRRGLKRLLGGSTSAAVANRAHCSVRVIHGRGVSHSESLDRSERSKKIQPIAYKSLGLRKAA
ncbi:MAG TPA: universal stress protein [Pyrinomonadaceae bacterium]|nr:universal stress protein [Pyrinomonadaceae bacterium]